MQIHVLGDIYAYAHPRCWNQRVATSAQMAVHATRYGDHTRTHPPLSPAGFMSCQTRVFIRLGHECPDCNAVVERPAHTAEDLDGVVKILTAKSI